MLARATKISQSRDNSSQPTARIGRGINVGESARGAMSLSLGVGLTNACDLACAHCYRDTGHIDQLSLEHVASACECLPVRSVNLGTGENGLHPDYAEIVSALAAGGVKLSLTSNGYTIEHSSDETLSAFREVEVSID